MCYHHYSWIIIDRISFFLRVFDASSSALAKKILQDLGITDEYEGIFACFHGFILHSIYAASQSSTLKYRINNEVELGGIWDTFVW